MVSDIRGKTSFKDTWLILLMAAQPALDALAFWTKSADGTIAGYIRLGILLLLPLYLLFALKKKKAFIISMLVIGAYCAFHVLNGFRVGYIDMFADVSYMLKVVQMPILAVCFVFFLNEESMQIQARRGIIAAVLVYSLALALSYITGTANSTYGDGVGVCGWVISDNRCCNSIILVILSTFTMAYGVGSKKKALNVLIPVCVTAILLANGTKACYGALFVLLFGYAAFIVLNRFVNGEKINKLILFTLMALMVVSVLIYPYTPRAKVSLAQEKAYSVNQIDVELSKLGYDLDAMTTEEKMADPVVREVYERWYGIYINALIPDMISRFGMEKVLLKYDMSYSAAVLGDNRLMKVNYSSLIFEQSDSLTKLAGFQFPELLEYSYDLENDWPAILFYYGYTGAALYGVFVLYFLYLIIKKMLTDFKASFNLFNLALLMCFVLQIGLAQFSGALLRRPNASIYMSLVMGLIYYRTVARSSIPAAWGRALPDEG